MGDIYYYGNQPMLKYTEDGTPKAISVPQQAADRIAELEAELRQSDAALEIAKIANRELKDELIAVEKNCDYWADRGKELEAQVNRACQWKYIGHGSYNGDTGDHHLAYEIECGGKIHSMDVPDYCPYCGGKVVSDE